MKCGDYENKRMILRDMLFHIDEHWEWYGLKT
jgi:hypothetical protein